MNKYHDKKIINELLRRNIIKKSILMGWEIREIDNKTIMLCKNVDNLTSTDKNTDRFLDILIGDSVMS